MSKRTNVPGYRGPLLNGCVEHGPPPAGTMLCQTGCCRAAIRLETFRIDGAHWVTAASCGRLHSALKKVLKNVEGKLTIHTAPLPAVAPEWARVQA